MPGNLHSASDASAYRQKGGGLVCELLQQASIARAGHTAKGTQ